MAKVTSVRLEDELSQRVEALAESLDRSKSWIIEQAIRSYLDEQLWQVAAIKEALEDYRSGNAILVPHDEVVAEIEELQAEIRGSLNE